MKVEIRELLQCDEKIFLEHRWRHEKENGPNLENIFMPTETDFRLGREEFIEKNRKFFEESFLASNKNSKQLLWQKIWLLVTRNNNEKTEIKGELRLVQRPPLTASLHRCVMMMGLENEMRGQGWGKKLIEQAFEWAQNQENLEWVDLMVFENNQMARKLYQNMGFQEIGRTVDCFRVYGHKITDILMTKKLLK